MGVSTTLFVTAKPEVILDLMPKLIEDLNVWQRAKLDAEVKLSKYDNRLQFLWSESKINFKYWSNGIASITTNNFSGFNLIFRINGETRNLRVTHTCSNDAKDVYDGDKIIFSLNCWGMCEEIMMAVNESVKGFGDVYYEYSDAEDNYIKLNQ
jgi:hypothetical protein